MEEVLNTVANLLWGLVLTIFLAGNAHTLTEGLCADRWGRALAGAVGSVASNVFVYALVTNGWVQ